MIRLELADRTVDRAMLHDIVHEFYAYQIPLTLPEVAEQLSPEMATQGFWDEFDDYFAPNGALVLAYDAGNALIGMGMMRKIRPDAAEFKRMYVRRTGRGHRIGRKMIEMRIKAAKDLGLKTVFADTLKASKTMHDIYRDMGFKEIPRYPESHTVVHFPMVADDLLYFQRDL